MRARMPRTSIPPSPGNSRSSRAVWMMPASVGGISFARVAHVGEAEPFARQRGELVEARVGAAEVQHVDQDAGVAPVDRAHDARRLGEIAGLGPVRKFEAHEDADARFARSHRRANRSIVALAVGIRAAAR